MKKVAIYCRVSSDDQKERDTIENQVDILHTYIEMRDGLSAYGEYLDNGISGTVPFVQRPEGSRLLKDASKGYFDTVLVWKIDRFGRDTLSGLKAVEMLSKYNIEIMSVTEPFDMNTPTGRFQFITYLNMAELERNNILDRMYIGATRAAKQGKWMGGIVPYGYNVNKDGLLEVKDDEAKIIIKIFELYVNERLSTISIALYLNNSGILSSCGTGKGKRTKNITAKWRAGTIQRILNNTTYKGIHYYGKRGTRRKDLIKRDVPPIISAELWDKAQKVKVENTIISKRNNTKRNYLLRGLIKCKYCGKTFYGVSYKNRSDFYVCSGKRGENKRVLGIKCNALNINAEEIEKSVWNDCEDILKHYDTYIEALENSSTSRDDNTENELNNLKYSLSSKVTEKNNILALYRKNIITEDEVADQLKDIKKEENNINNLISTFEEKLNCYKHENELITSMSNKLKYYSEKIDNLTFEEKYNVVKLLVKEIITETIVQDGYKTSKYEVIYNLVKLDNLMDKDSLSRQA